MMNRDKFNEFETLTQDYIKAVQNMSNNLDSKHIAGIANIINQLRDELFEIEEEIFAV